MSWWEVALLVPLAGGVLLGIAGSVLPLLPGPPLILAVGAGYAWVTGFRHLGSTTLIALAVLTAASMVVDWLAGALGAAGAGASRLAVITATVLGVAGLFLGPWWAVVALPLLGVAAVERIAGRSTRRSLRAAAGVGIGTVVSGILRVTISVAMGLIIVFGFLSS
ncbi:DUF456 domain-containing protein [Candidatus Fermentibacteria bacterium]|nr:DUF456 domain-containing protein [Candidatus Fermentibacteria bacterium]